MTAEEISNIDEYVALDAQLKAIGDRKRKLVAEIVKLGAGDYETAKSKIRVVMPIPKIAPTQEKIAVVRESVAADDFKLLFDRVVSFKPVEHFRDFLTRASSLSVTQVRKVLAICETPSNPYIVIR